MVAKTAEARREAVLRIIRSELGMGEQEPIQDSSSLVEDLGADSLDRLELLMSLEEEFALSIPDEEIERMETVGDVIAYLDRQAVAAA